MKAVRWLGWVVALLLAWGCQRGRETDKAGGPWLTDFEAAKVRSAELKRPILADFSGSDWCGYCIALDQEVFQQSVFRKFANENLVLFLADFPKYLSQTEGLRMQNEMLMARYGVDGRFPTVFLLDAQGRVLAQTGYLPGGAAAYVKHLKTLMAQPSAE